MTIFTDMQASAAVAKKFEEDGYVVTVEPNPTEIPFHIGNYRPDLLAVKPGDNVIVEVKRAGSKIDATQYFQVAESAAAHSGWSFKIVTLPDRLSEASPQREGGLEQIAPLLAKVDALLALSDMEGFAVVSLWNAYVTALQLLVGRYSLKAKKLTDLGLLNLAYSLGILAFEEVEKAKRLLDLRNHAAHALVVNVTPTDVAELRAHVQQLLQLLSEPTNHDGLLHTDVN